MDRDGCSTSKSCVPRKMGTGGGGNKGENKFLVVSLCHFILEEKPSPVVCSLNLTDHRHVQENRDQACSLYSFYDRAGQEMGEMKVGSC